jgi:pimeloyl-ACP methyl ester carboxylesterase
MTGWLLLLATGLLCLCGAGYERWAAARDRRRLPMPGQHVQVGETLLHVGLLGRRMRPSHPVLVLDGGLVRGSLAWTQVVAALGADWLVVVFDRAGHNWSTRAHGPRTAEANLAEQREMLAQLHLAPPWLLVAHGYATHIARLHAARHPTDIGGLVLVDPLPAAQAAACTRSAFARSLWWKLPAARLGLWRLARHLPARRAPAETGAALLWQSAKDLEAARAELACLARDVATIEAAAPPAQPCLLVAATRDSAPLRAMAARLPQGGLRLVDPPARRATDPGADPGATPWAAPDVVVRAIREVAGRIAPSHPPPGGDASG